MTNQLFFGDNLDVLRDHIASESVDLIYLDPPFNSNANYNILFKSKTGDGADAQIEAFEDYLALERPCRGCLRPGNPQRQFRRRRASTRDAHVPRRE